MGQYGEQWVEDVARTCHEANRAICQAFGDHSQESWDNAPTWQRESAIKGVRLHLSNPELGLNASHEAWMQDKKDNGWVFGHTKDAVAKTHPCLIPFEQLARDQQVKDYVFRAIVHAAHASSDRQR